ncbi:MAG: threonine ammonia-lyase [Proteobacteria bacterium]|nr:threonine ammonia-lyase [Pseudomonadota bacterium]
MNYAFSHQDIQQARQNIGTHVRHTPMTHSRTLSDLTGCKALFKLENLQMTGSFKERGALNRLLHLSPEEKARGVIAASAGNHAQALAYHAGRLGISVKIVMPRYSPIVKIRSTEHWGAEVILAGDTFDDAMATSREIVAEEQRVYIHPFDDPLIAAGQGTVGLEIIEDPTHGQIDAVLVPVGGGGLLAGIAMAIKSQAPDVQVIGIEEASCQGMHQALQAGQPVMVAPAPVIADGIAVRQVSADNLKIVNAMVDEVVAVTSDEIANAIMLMLEIEKTVVEGAAATPLAALVNNRLPQLRGKTVVSVISGGNIDVNLLTRIIEQGLAFDGRVFRIETVVQDRPGKLEGLLSVFRQNGANILEVIHHRISPRAPIGQVGISVTVETRDRVHLEEIERALEQAGYPRL